MFITSILFENRKLLPVAVLLAVALYGLFFVNGTLIGRKSWHHIRYQLSLAPCHRAMCFAHSGLKHR